MVGDPLAHGFENTCTPTISPQCEIAAAFCCPRQTLTIVSSSNVLRSTLTVEGLQEQLQGDATTLAHHRIRADAQLHLLLRLGGA